MTTIADRLVGAPISWGVCEVPGWGWQPDSATVLSQMHELGLSATEFGPDGFLPEDPQVRAKALAERGLRGVGGFVPVILHDPAIDPVKVVEPVLSGFIAGGADTLVLAAATGTVGYDDRQKRNGRNGRNGLDDDDWQVLLGNLDRLARFAERFGITATLHPHVGTMVATADEVGRVLAGSGIGLCLDTGHLLIGGADPVALAAANAGRVRHTHLKDVDARWAAAVDSGEVTYTEAVRAGMYQPLGQGDVDIASIVESLERAGYKGWYVLEQDTILAGPPEPGHHGPMADVRASVEYLLTVAQAIS